MNLNRFEMVRTNTQITRRHCLFLTGAAAVSILPGVCLSEINGALPRWAISEDTLAGTNINDARAAYAIWTNEVSRQSNHISAQIVPGIFIPSEDLIRRVRQGMLECYGVTALEFAKIADLTDPDVVMLQDYLIDGIEYVLLVHNGSAIKTVADLRDARLLSLQHRDTVLLPAWLDTMLVAANLPKAERYFGSVTLHGKVNEVILPVFFRHAEAGCLTRQSWETAVELNPQLGRDLRALATSPKVIPIVIGFSRKCDKNALKQIIDSMQLISTTAAGQQLSSFYGAHGFVAKPTSVMNSTLEMVRQYERLTTQAAGPRKGKP